MAKVELRRVSKIYPAGVVALDEVDLVARDGEILVLLGPNGSGKTTLLRLIAGLERLSAGEIRIGGEVVDGLPPSRRGVAMMFQGCVLYPHLTAEQNMVFGLESSNGGWTDWVRSGLASLFGAEESAARSRSVRERVRHVAQLLGIERLLDRLPRQLSGGECQRVALGRVLVRQPAVFLLDEPWSQVDVRSRQQLRRELRRVRGHVGGAMILVAHDHAEALAVGDRVAVIDGGRILQIGLPAEVIAAPRTRLVAELVGGPAMNFVSGHLRRRDGIMEFESGEWWFEIARNKGELLPECPAWLGFRAAAVGLERAPADGESLPPASARRVDAALRSMLAETEASARAAGEIEAGEIEAGKIEAGKIEAGETEAGETEAGEIEAGETEAGETEAAKYEASSSETNGGDESSGYRAHRLPGSSWTASPMGPVLRGEVVGCEDLAGVHYVYVKPHGQMLLEPAGEPLVARVHVGERFCSGDEVWLRVDHDQVLFFDQQAGSNISLGLEVKSQ